jgi:acetylornithine deacetylase/succinyl-diaminopimelate desuccinylase-like protein
MSSLAESTSAATIARELIRFDTTNPPGDEAGCIAHVAALLRSAGIECQTLGRTPERPNLIARIPGRSSTHPLLLHGHVDVVTTAGQSWQQPPFDAQVVDGYIWGRGALDMKGGVAMMVAAILRLLEEGVQPASDLLLAVVSDEETGSDEGAGWLVREHPELFHGVRYSIGEGGGRSFMFAGLRFYPIAVAEKRVCWMQATLRGRGGHGAVPVSDGTMGKLGRVLRALDDRKLPVHVTEPVRLMVEAMAEALPGVVGESLKSLLDGSTADEALRQLPARRDTVSALLRNTVTPTMLTASDKVNVIPPEVRLGLDGRLLPGYSADDMLAELHDLVGDELDIEVVRNEASESRVDMSGYPFLAAAVRQMDPEAVPVPSMVAGFTDGCQFSKLGIQNYGFLPLRIPDGVDLESTVHGADERIPTDALEAGTRTFAHLIAGFQPTPEDDGNSNE